MKKSNYEFDIVVNGSPLKEYYHDRKYYVEGKKETEFSLRIRNNGSAKIVAIPSVDGLSVMNGKQASFKSNGYIINGYDSLTIDGWRTSDKDVAKFYFSDPENSYSKRKGDGNNLGIIGLAIFQEKYNIQREFEDLKKEIDKKFPPLIPWPTIPIDPCPCPRRYPWWSEPFITWGGSSITYTNNGTNQTMLLSASSGENNVVNSSVDKAYKKNEQTKGQWQELGTGWGESKKSEVVSVNFDREDNPSATFEIYYNTRKQLEEIGIDFSKKPVYVTPQAFPGQYCEPPKH